VKWTTKARIQRMIARLPSPLSYALYYRLQRSFGGLGSVDPSAGFRYARNFWSRIEASGVDPRGKRFLEVGTGRRITVPLGLWLMGAGEVVTVDLNPYLREELVHEDLQRLLADPGRLALELGPGIDPDRVQRLLSVAARRWGLAEILEQFGITYLAPADAAQLPLEAASIDFHISVTVFEHIPGDVLLAILREGNRLMKPGGRFVHRIDYSDHFAHADRSINLINFLQFNSAEWDMIAGNRYMYMNRLRDDDFVTLFRDAGQTILAHEPDHDDSLRGLLEAEQVPVHSSFATKPKQVLATTGAWFVTTPPVI
jgi:SAM-dependent methyltransferase